MSTKKKTHWFRTTLIVFIVCGIIGTVIAGVRFAKTQSTVYAQTSLQLTFEGAAEGLAPNGNRYDVQEMASDELLLSALEAASLSETYTPEQIRSGLRIKGVYPEDIVEQIMSYDSLLDFTANRTISVSDYHPTTFNISLSNAFDPAISQTQLTGLLDQIVNAYKKHFAASGGYKLETEDSVFIISDYDYPQQLDIIRTKLEVTSAYAKELDEKYPSFRLNGQSFNDISVRVENLISSDLGRVEAQLTMNALTKDTARLLTQYQFEIRDLKNQLQKKNDQLEKIDTLVASYEKNEIIYLSTSDSLTKIDGNSSETYDRLVATRKSISDEITTIQSKINVFELKIQDLMGEETETATPTENILSGSGEALSNASAQKDESGIVQETTESVSTMSEEKIETVAAQAAKTAQDKINALETEIESLRVKLGNILSDFDAMIQTENDEQINELTFTVSTVKYNAPSMISGSFLKQVIKTAGPFCAIGLMVCFILIFISRWKESRKLQEYSK